MKIARTALRISLRKTVLLILSSLNTTEIYHEIIGLYTNVT